MDLSAAPPRLLEFLAAEALVTGTLSTVLLLVIWQIVGARVSPILMSTPDQVIGQFWTILINGELVRATLATLTVFLSAFALSIVLGVPLGLVTGSSRLARNIVEPWVRTIYVLPSIAFLPLLITWVGIGMTLKVAVAFISAFFVVLINTEAGVKSVDRNLIDVAKSFNASSGQIFRYVIFPGAVPFVMAGLRVAISRAMLGTVIAEMFAAVSGLGDLLLKYGSVYFTARVFAVLVALSILSLVVSAVVERIEARFSLWRTG